MNFIYKHFTGGYALPFFGRYIHFPKLAPLMIVAISSLSYGEFNDKGWMALLGYALFAFGVYCFFLPVRKG